MAQGGMNGVTGVTDEKDTVESHMFDTVKGGDYLCDQDAVEYFAENAGKIIYEMDYMGSIQPSKGWSFSSAQDGRLVPRTRILLRGSRGTRDGTRTLRAMSRS